MNPLLIALAHVEAINSRELGRISKLMAADHVFIDSDATEVRDPQKVLAGWSAYFSTVPDYRIDIEEVFVRNNSIVLLGRASGTFITDGELDSENSWSVPAAWRTEIRNNKISLWQVYVNPEPLVNIMERLGKPVIHPIGS
jgi:hypothetical protein